MCLWYISGQQNIIKDGRWQAVPLHGAGLRSSGKYEEGYWRSVRILKS